MTMITETTKMIYGDKAVALQIAHTMSLTGAEYDVVPVTAGFQVAKITKCPSAMPKWPPMPFKKADPLVKMLTAAIDPMPPVVSAAQLAAETIGAVTPKNHVVVKMAFRGESPKYIDAWTADGAPISFGKSTLLTWEVTDEDGSKFVAMLMHKSTAAKRKVEAYIV